MDRNHHRYEPYKPPIRRMTMKAIAARLRVIMDEVNGLAEEVEAYVMKKTTQRSPEWSGRANR